MKTQAVWHLKNEMLPFWSALEDKEFGGCYGLVDGKGNIDKEADKSGLQLSRSLWFFSAAARVLEDEAAAAIAERYFLYLEKYLYDRQEGGVYYTLFYDNRVKSRVKNVYFQAFALYALSEYAMFRGENARNAETLAFAIFDYIERVFRAEGGYHEQFGGENLIADKGCVCPRTMNSVLHILEAYTNLYRLKKDERVGEAIRALLRLFADKIYNPEKERLEVFFDDKYHSLSDYHSFGHDIEASWLLEEAVKVLDGGGAENALTGEIIRISDALAERVCKEAFDGEFVDNERVNGNLDTDRIWWVQAEAVNGFLKAYKRTGETKYKDVAEKIFENIEKTLISEYKEWYWLVKKAGGADETLPLASQWKCPYHNGRMYLEILKEERGE